MTSSDEMSTSESTAWGALAISFFLLHLIWHVDAGDPCNALWACHIASMLIGLGAIARKRTVVIIGLLWLAIGIPLWGIFLLGGGTLVPTSLLTHFGAGAVGLVLMRKSPFRFAGPPRVWGMVWWRAFFALAALVLLSRLLTDRADNINLAFDIHGKSETTTQEHAQYLLGLSVVISTVFVASEILLRKLFCTKHAILSDR